MNAVANVDAAELAKFSALAHQFWDPHGPLQTLHSINPVRLGYVTARAGLAGSAVADIGCGGGLFAEALCRQGARVTAIDMSVEMIEVARLHLLESGLSVDYRVAAAAELAATHAGQFSVVCCMELIEHVPDPAALMQALATLLQPGGSLFISTINRNLRSFLGAIVAAEYLLGLVPRGTHEYARLIRPAELARAARAAGLELGDLGGLAYDPLTRKARLGVAPDINYIAQFTRAADQA
jgi:2-polyprenyl-6-hydroxyphenyl methylase/3-demethylubiquinone-9 3-methyltransferase